MRHASRNSSNVIPTRATPALLNAWWSSLAASATDAWFLMAAIASPIFGNWSEYVESVPSTIIRSAENTPAFTCFAVARGMPLSGGSWNGAR